MFLNEVIGLGPFNGLDFLMLNLYDIFNPFLENIYSHQKSISNYFLSKTTQTTKNI